MAQIGQNVTVEVKDGKLIATVDLSQKGTPSASGKSIVIGSTRGNVKLAEHGVSLGLNVYRKA